MDIYVKSVCCNSRKIHIDPVFDWQPAVLIQLDYDTKFTKACLLAKDWILFQFSYAIVCKHVFQYKLFAKHASITKDWICISSVLRLCSEHVFSTKFNWQIRLNCSTHTFKLCAINWRHKLIGLKENHEMIWSQLDQNQ